MVSYTADFVDLILGFFIIRLSALQDVISKLIWGINLPGTLRKTRRNAMRNINRAQRTRRQTPFHASTSWLPSNQGSRWSFKAIVSSDRNPIKIKASVLYVARAAWWNGTAGRGVKYSHTQTTLLFNSLL